jgi:asparagine synthase (glutamine-hydrolysing)
VASVSSFLDPLPPKTHISNEQIYETLDQAVKRQLVSDRPVGAYRSGGFDSSIVVHHMAKYSPHTRTYSVDFEAVSGQENDSEKFNADARLARLTASFYGTEHKTFTISLQDVRDSLETALSSVSEPVANSTAVTQYLLSDFVRKDGVVVVLGGDGGDELFGGYTRHRIAMGAYLYQRLPSFMQRMGALLSPRIGKLSTPFYTPLHRVLMVKDEKKILPFLAHSLPINEKITEYFDNLYHHTPKEGMHPLDVFMNVDRRTWLADECFIRSDYASMAHGLELRVPFVDTDVVACADQLSIWRKVLPHEGKRVIRETYKKYLPPHLYQEPKRGWLSPAAKWFRDPEINAFAKQVFSSTYYSGLDGLLNWESVQEMLDAHVEKRGYYLYPLWNILALQIWARKNGIVNNTENFI